VPTAKSRIAAAIAVFIFKQFVLSLYLVEYHIANGAFGRVSFSSNCLKFNGYDGLPTKISDPTESAGTFHGDLAFLMFKAEPIPGPIKILAAHPPHMRPYSIPCVRSQFNARLPPGFSN
jgi:hypothetical protein